MKKCQGVDGEKKKRIHLETGICYFVFKLNGIGLGLGVKYIFQCVSNTLCGDKWLIQ